MPGEPATRSKNLRCETLALVMSVAATMFHPLTERPTLTVREAADVLGVDVKTLDAVITAGRVRAG
jgi:hypothetical protein